MIDKVDLKVPTDAPYSGAFSALYQEIRSDPKGPFRRGRHYLASADLRQYGYPVILHTHCLHGKRGDHKLEILDAGKMAYSEIAAQIGRVFQVPPTDLRVMRVDLAADVPGVPVIWFEQHVRAAFKRWTAEIGKLNSSIEFASMGKQGVETFYLGKRPNVFRIYNKIAELHAQYDRDNRHLKRDSPDYVELPTFQHLFGYPESGFILTRVERQFGGRVPESIGTFGDLLNAADINPFDRLVFTDIGKPEPSPDDYDLQTYAMGKLIQSLVEAGGFHRAKQFLNRHSKRNANRILRRVSDFLPSDATPICPEKLFALYRESISKQLAA